MTKQFPKIQIIKFKLDQHDKIEEFVDQAVKKLDGLDILVNNAGITLDNLSIRLSENDWKKVLDINLTSSFFNVQKCNKKNVKKKIR